MSITVITKLAEFDHPYLDAIVMCSELHTELGRLSSPPELIHMLSSSHPSPFESAPDDTAAVRRLLRFCGFKPSGRNKPASEYLVQAIAKGRLGSINPVVDAVNVASFHGGLPISVVDADALDGAPRFMVPEAGASYVFNAAGQTIDVEGLLCLADEQGPCANAVKDSQRTKTGDTTTRLLTVIWGTTELPGRAEAVSTYYRQLLDSHLMSCA